MKTKRYLILFLFVCASHTIFSQNQIIIEHEYDAMNERHLTNMIYTDGNLYCFQLSSFKEWNLAEKDAKSLRDRGHQVIISEAIPFNDGKVWFRVRIGYFSSLEEARKYKEKYLK